MNTRIKQIVLDGLEDLRIEVMAHKDAGRVKRAEDLELFCDACSDYIRMLEKTIRASRETIRALEERKTKCQAHNS